METLAKGRRPQITLRNAAHIATVKGLLLAAQALLRRPRRTLLAAPL
jgi:hypothetical protein